MGYMQFDNDGTHKEPNTLEKIGNCVEKCLSLRKSRGLVLFIVFVAIFLDNMLLTVVVPIMPDFLFSLSRAKENKTFFCNATTKSNYHNTSRPMSLTMGRMYVGSRHPTWLKHDHLPSNINVNDSCWKEELAWRKKQIDKINVEVGLMFASKSIVQMIANPFVGPLTNKIGYSIPMFSGFVIMFTSTIRPAMAAPVSSNAGHRTIRDRNIAGNEVFAFGGSYGVLLIARALQGVGSACSSVSGMGMVAQRYPEDEERGSAMSLALGGLALGVVGMGMLATCFHEERERSHAFAVALGGLAMGVLVGPPFGGVTYQFIGKPAPFLFLAALAVLDGLLQLAVLKPAVRPEPEEGAPIINLLKDPYILIAAGSITFGNIGVAMLEPSLPLWMKTTMHAPEWEQGVAFLPASILYLVGTNVFGPLAHRIGRWLSAGLGMLIIGACLICIPFATNIGLLVPPMMCFGFAIGMVDSSMMPLMGNLVDLRHVSVYGSVYAIADAAFCLGFAIGPAISGPIVEAVGFPWMIWIIAIVILLYAPLSIFLRNPPARDEKTALVMKSQMPQQYTPNGKDDALTNGGDIEKNRLSSGNIPEKEDEYFSD